MTNSHLSMGGGRLPPEVIQHVIRQSFGRLRACYASALLRSPGLEGRVVVKFVIDREGEVTMASTTESSIEDASVNHCVAQAYEAMLFPKPAGGVVTVVYPVVFTRSEP
jgi:TonB family protein